MKGKAELAFAGWLLFWGLSANAFAGGDWQVGLGLSAGVSRLEGDLKKPNLSPLVVGHIRVLPVPYVALDGSFGFSSLGASSHPTFTDFKTTIVPFELSAIFNFLPFRTVNPYVFAGGGGVFWKAKGTDATGASVTAEDGIDSFFKVGAGLEFRIARSVGVSLGATYRLSLTDAFDQINQGDEDDQVLNAHAGFTYYFGGGGHDRDHDLIPDELDLMPEIAEDRDGYLDHDGIPEKNPNPIAMSSIDAPFNDANGAASPIVIHHIIETAESGKDLSVKAQVYSERPLKVVAALYRPSGTRRWNVIKLDGNEENLYTGEIPGYAVTDDGLEYCVVAVDESLSGVGYSGLPNKPIGVKVSPSGTVWRIVGGTVGAAAIGTASYLVLRKQE